MPDDWSFSPGDILMVQPKNNTEAVLDFIKDMHLKPNQLLKIQVLKQHLGQVSQSSVLSFPEKPLTVIELFSYWLNLMEPPSRYFMQVLQNFVDNEMHKEKLAEFASKTVDGKSEYHRYAVRERRTVIEVLNDFYPVSEENPSRKISLPLSYLIQLCGR